MPYRELIAAGACHQCDTESTASCGCCGRATCARHLATPSTFCGRCDEGLYRHMRQGGDWLSLWFMAGLVPLLIVAAVIPPMGVLAVAYGLIGLPVMVSARRRRRRAQFIAGVRATGALPAPPPEEEHERRAREIAAYERRRNEARLDTSKSARGEAPSRDDASATPVPAPGSQPE